MPPFAPAGHVLPPAAPLAALQWPAAALIVAGGVLLLLRGAGWLRRVGWTALAAGAAVSVGIEVAAAATAPAARIVSIIQPLPGARVTSPLLVSACGHRSDGTPVRVPGQGEVLAILVDGHEALATSGSSGAVVAAVGVHSIRAEVLTAGHRRLQPPLAAEVRVVVTGPGPLPATPRCAR